MCGSMLNISTSGINILIRDSASLVPEKKYSPFRVRFPYLTWLLMMDSINFTLLSHSAECYPTLPVRGEKLCEHATELCWHVTESCRHAR